MDADRGFIEAGEHPHQRFCVSIETMFPKLRDFIALEQGIIDIVLWDDDEEPDKQSCQLRYPCLRRFYAPGYDGGCLSSVLPYLDDLRLELLDTMCVSPPPREQVDHVGSLIIDAPRYIPPIVAGCLIRQAQTWDEYASKLSKYRNLIDGVGSSERNGLVVPGNTFAHCTNWGCILSAWTDAVVGGEGCWTTTWIPTIPYSESHQTFCRMLYYPFHPSLPFSAVHSVRSPM